MVVWNWTYNISELCLYFVMAAQLTHTLCKTDLKNLWYLLSCLVAGPKEPGWGQYHQFLSSCPRSSNEMLYGTNQMDLVPVLVVRLIRVGDGMAHSWKISPDEEWLLLGKLWLSHVSEDLVSRATDCHFCSPFLLGCLYRNSLERQIMSPFDTEGRLTYWS